MQRVNEGGDRLILCRTCGPGSAGRLAAAVEASLPQGMEVVLADCLNACGRPLALALRGPGKAVYLFAAVDEADAADLAALARLYAEAPDGVIADARPAGRLRTCLLGRVPA